MLLWRNRTYWILLLALCLGGVLLTGGVALAQDEEPEQPVDVQVMDNTLHLPMILGSSPIGDRALEAAAAQLHVPASQLAIVAAGEANYPMSGKTVMDFKVEDAVTGVTYLVTMDATGAVLSEAELIAAEEAAYFARFGRMEPALAEMVAGAAAEQTIPVVLWLNEPEYQGPARPDPMNPMPFANESEVEAYFAQVDAMRAAAVAQVVAPMAGELQGMGYEVMTDAYAPMLAGALRVETIRGLAQRGDIAMIYLDRVNEAELEVARPTIYANTVHSRGYTGYGVRLAQVEVGGRIATANPYLSGVTLSTTYVCSSASSHSTGVAGIIRSTHTSRRGIAYGATLWAGGSCYGYDSQLTNRSTAAADWGARAINLSWGSNIGLVPGSLDRFYDTMIINRYRTIVKSAGNRGSGCGYEGNITSPGLGYNMIAVGNFNDMNTTSWTGDAMSSCSSWRDPTSVHSDREKPEVAAPGTNINSTTTGYPWTGGIGSGTSFAAPMVTGESGLLMQRRTALQSWPEAVRAIIMASAAHNIEGAIRLSEYDGAGGIVVNRADDIARGYNGNWGAQGYSCSTTNPLNFATVYLYSGQRLRVVISWDNNPAYASYSSRPSADLDLSVRNAAGSTVASSSSWDNTYEIVDYTATASGNYTLRINRYSCYYSPSWLGWAWIRVY